jgi:hypothetical protein
LKICRLSSIANPRVLSAGLAAVICFGYLPWADLARADRFAADPGYQEESTARAAEYHTLLAGEQNQTTFLGKTVFIPARDRGRITSLTLGGFLLEPEQGDTLGLPVVALYLRRINEEYRTRAVVSIFVNELEYDKSFGHLDWVGHFENFTLPYDRTEVVNNREIKPSSVTYGTLLGSLGAGLRFPVSPDQIDNDLRLQLLGRVGYFYAKRTKDTGADLTVPPSTAPRYRRTKYPNNGYRA